MINQVFLIGFIILLYGGLVIGFLAFPFIGTLVLKPWVKPRKMFIFAILFLIQFLVLVYIYQKPLVSYSNGIEFNNDQLIRDEFRLYSGFYSNALPLVAWKVHVIKYKEYDEKTGIDVRINYFPFGYRTVGKVDLYSEYDNFLKR